MIPSKKVEELILKHKSLEGELSSGNIDKKLFATKSKEYSDLNEIIDQAKKYLNFEKNKKDLEKLIQDNDSDKEIKEMAQLELDQLINQINKVSDETSYGHNSLLDGSHGARGVATGKHLEFIGINADSKTSPLSGYQILVTEVATRSELKGVRPFTQEIIDNEESLIFEEGGIGNRFVTQKGVSVLETFRHLRYNLVQRFQLKIMKHSR